MWWLLSACDTTTEPSTTLPPVVSETTTTSSPTTPTPTGTTTSSTTGTPGPVSVLQFSGPAPTNLVIISLDTTRRDHIGRFGHKGNTPNLDAVLAEGVALDDHRSCSSWTGPSMTCVTTGLTPFDRNWFPWNSDPDVANSDPTMPTIAGQLQFQFGWRTAMITANSVFGPTLGLDRGFQSVTFSGAAANTTDLALEQARELHGDESSPYYLHVHYIDPHAPYCPPDEYVESDVYEPFSEDICSTFYTLAGGYASESAAWREVFSGNVHELYDAELDYWDTEFGRLWDGLDEAGVLDDALVVFVTDHGEQFFERGGWGHGNTLHAEENRSTAGFWARNLIPQAWSDPTVHEDVGATVIDYFGTKPLQELTGVVVGVAAPDRPVRGMLYWSGGGAAQLSITQGTLQLTYAFWGEKHLWDYALDPTGMVDYYDPADPDVQALWVHMQEYIEEVLTQWPSAGPATDPGP
jgi:arylsulfatase A-like enzyme